MTAALTRPLPPDASPLQVKLLGLTRHFESQVRSKILTLTDLNNVSQSQAQIALALSPFVSDFGSAAAALAARDYESERKDWVSGGYAAWVADSPPREQVAATTAWALKPLASLDDDADEDEATDAAADRLIDGTARQILNVARSTSIGNVARDRQSVGWERVAASGACAFCLMLASRGISYRSQATASFRAHDHCQCVARAKFRGQDLTPTPVAQAAQQLWRDTASSGPCALSDFRAGLKAARANGTWDELLSQVNA